MKHRNGTNLHKSHFGRDNIDLFSSLVDYLVVFSKSMSSLRMPLRIFEKPDMFPPATVAFSRAACGTSGLCLRETLSSGYSRTDRESCTHLGKSACNLNLQYCCAFSGRDLTQSVHLHESHGGRPSSSAVRRQLAAQLMRKLNQSHGEFSIVAN